MISTTHLRQRKNEAGLWMVGALVLVATMVILPGQSWGGEAACPEAASEALFSIGASMTSESVEEPAYSRVSTPCTRSQYDAPGYNVCHIASPSAVSTIPKWLAELQAEEAAASVFDSINDFHPTNATNERPLHSRIFDRDLAELIDFLEKAEVADGPVRMCVEGGSEDNCESIPPAAVLVCSGASIPVIDPPQLPQIPRHLDRDDTQPPLVNLRVGPARGFHSPPDRPPTTSTS